MEQNEELIERLRGIVERELAADQDHMTATKPDDLAWLAAQLVRWPHERVDPDKTMCDSFLRLSSAATMFTLQAENQKLEDHVREMIVHVEQRIQDGKEMGATVWRIALEDVAREARTLLGDET